MIRDGLFWGSNGDSIGRYRIQSNIKYTGRIGCIYTNEIIKIELIGNIELMQVLGNILEVKWYCIILLLNKMGIIMIFNLCNRIMIINFYFGEIIILSLKILYHIDRYVLIM